MVISIQRIKLFLFLLLFSGSYTGSAQIQITLMPQQNSVCNGFGCNYEGPTILINEVMTRPVSGNGSIFGNNNAQRGEWIELYNPDLCQSIDISCYFLGNNAPDNGGDWGGGFELPPGTVVPPRGFVIVRGSNAPAVPSNLLVQNGGRTIEVVIQNTPSVCIGGGQRLWFPDSGGWFAFYDENGVPQDAISWNNINNSDPDGNPCNPPNACPFTGTLPSYNAIPSNRKTYIDNNQAIVGQSYRRLPDGGAWDINNQGAATYGNCNAICAPPPVITCTGQITVLLLGAVPPVTYVWDDGQLQTTQTAVGLCAGTYCVTVTDATGSTATACIEVDEFKPVVDLAPQPVVCANAPAFALSGGNPAGGVFSGPGVSGGLFYPEIAGSGDHQISYTWYNSDSCFNSDTAILQVLPLPEGIFGPVEQICVNTMPVDLTAYAQPAGGSFFGPGVSGTHFNPGLTGIGNVLLNYVIAGQNGCKDTLHTDVVVHGLPEVTHTALDSICLSADSVLLTGGSPAGGYYYGNGVINNYFYPALAGPGNILIVYAYSDTNNCTDTALRGKYVWPPPVLSFPALPDVCEGSGPVSLGSATPSGGTYSGIAVTGLSFDPALAGSGIHPITYTYTDFRGCSAEVVQTQTVRELPDVGLNPVESLCADSPPVVLNSGTPPGGTYSGAGVSGNSFDPQLSGTGSFTITYTYRDQYSCENDTSGTMIVHPLPLMYAVMGGGEICDDGPGFPVYLETSQTGVQYAVFFNSFNLGVGEMGNGDSLYFGEFGDAGYYTVLALDTATGCISDMDGYAEIQRIKSPVINLPDSTWLCDPAGVLLDAGTYLPDTVDYIWQDGTTTQVFLALQPGIYTVRVGKHACYAADSIEVKVCSELWLPNVFTPNSDGKNDRFLPGIKGDIIAFHIEVYNRWGKKMYESTDMKEGWDGSQFNSGTTCAEGVYYYVATYKGLGKTNPPQEIKLTGSVTLLR